MIGPVNAEVARRDWSIADPQEREANLAEQLKTFYGAKPTAAERLPPQSPEEELANPFRGVQ